MFRIASDVLAVCELFALLVISVCHDTVILCDNTALILMFYLKEKEFGGTWVCDLI